MIENAVPPGRRPLWPGRGRPAFPSPHQRPQPPQSEPRALPPECELHYPAGSVLMVAGIPGAGKSTLIRRLFTAPAEGSGPGLDGEPTADGRPTPHGRPTLDVVVLDSAQVRAALARWVGPWVPYKAYRPVVHTVHYWRIAAWTVGPRRNLVVHECGTRDWARRTVACLAAARGREAHLLFLDTPPELALAGQRSRGRVVRTKSFVRHSRSWARLRAAVDQAAASPAAASQRSRVVAWVTRAPSLRREGWTSARSLTRDQAAAVTAIHFD